MTDLRSLLHGAVSSNLWLARHFGPFARQLRESHGIGAVSPIARTTWHRGSRYFRGRDTTDRMLFIKTDGYHRLLTNEIAASHLLQAGASRDHFLPVRHHDLSAPYPFAAFDWSDGRTLGSTLTRLSGPETERVASELWSILQALTAAGLIHRDLTPDNLILRPGLGASTRLVLIDFAFVVHHGTAASDDRLPPLDLEHLGWGYKPAPLQWDDAYSCAQILRQVAPVPTPAVQEWQDRIKERVGAAVFQRDIRVTTSPLHP